MIREVKNQKEWDDLVEHLGGHPLQKWAWGELKSNHGSWQPVRIAIVKGDKAIGGAQILIRKLPGKLGRMAYVPRGPFASASDRTDVLNEAGKYAEGLSVIELKIEPDWQDFSDWPRDWRHSKNRVLLAKTGMIDLGRDASQIQSDFAKKTRQYIRKSEHNGVTIRKISLIKDIEKCMDIYDDTARRAKFALHDRDYYRDLAEKTDYNQIYLAEIDGRPLSFLWNVRTKATEFELYGGVNQSGQDLRANYILKWHAISEAKNADVKTYDMNGLLNDGVSNFKRGFITEDTELVGTWDLPLSPKYSIIETILPAGKKLLQTIRKMGKS